MTEAALTVLGAEPDQPFALFVEAGDVDFALHANNLDNAIGAVYSGEEAVRAVIDWVETHSNWDDSRPDRLGRPRPLPGHRRSPGAGGKDGARLTKRCRHRATGFLSDRPPRPIRPCPPYFAFFNSFAPTRRRGRRASTRLHPHG